MSFSKTLLAASLAAIGLPAVADEAAGASDGNVVVVTASMRAHTVAGAPAFTTVLTAEDIAKSPANGLADLLRDSVGVNNQTDGNGRDEIRIRGLGGKYTLMLVNGKRVSSGGALWRGGDFDFSSVPLSSIKRVEIVRGPMAALYGSDAIGGVINIITWPASKEWKGSVTGEYRTVASGYDGDQYRVGANASGALSDTVSLSLAGERYDRDAWWDTPASDKTRTPRLEEKKASNLTGTLTWQVAENQSLDFDLGYNKDKRPRVMYYYAFYPAYNFESKDIRDQDIERKTYGLTHRANWDWGNTTAYITRESAEIQDFNTRYNAPQQRTLKEDNTYAKFYGSTALGINALTAGVDLRRQVIHDGASYLDTGKVSTDTKAVFLEDELTLAKDLRLTLAGRFDDHSVFGGHFSPKSYLVWQSNDVLTVKGGISKAFKAPDAYQLSKEYRIVSCGGSCFLSGNPELSPETSTNYEIGFEMHQKTWDFTAVAFRNDVDGLIVATYDPVANARHWTNVAQAKTNGIELEGNVQLLPSLTLTANYTHLNADYVNEKGVTAVLDNRPKNVGMASLAWTVLPGVQTSLSAHYTGKQFYAEKEMPAYTRVDLGVSAKVDKHWTVRTGVKNLTDVDLAKKSKDFSFFELGRNYYVSATYGF
ncbi:TonB-dependent receptor domain-containing protein [Pseudoduganella violaceinigra]|uniref:TonB-dependent receptor domain-containing protein n=1 Tax=Pseudoduganella violaceinigra TaxID=246602 RepID=UPI0004888B34|nr:TonB-dependent receptor [Pseudoduganella violaceinigra]